MSLAKCADYLTKRFLPLKYLGLFENVAIILAITETYILKRAIFHILDCNNQINLKKREPSHP